jgi:hypothetical protein
VTPNTLSVAPTSYDTISAGGLTSLPYTFVALSSVAAMSRAADSVTVSFSDVNEVIVSITELTSAAVISLSFKAEATLDTKVLAASKTVALIEQ